MKRMIRLSESDLHRVIKESVRRYLTEGTESMDAMDAYKTVAKFLVNLDERKAIHIAAEILFLITRGTMGKSLDEVVNDVCQKFNYALHGNNK
jgi:hypothetical protein